ncbi:hypothetical protein M405DRAFT_824657 [Rhizopogon salebrosus TDB-379]|nr:hypothetical protein M405DRAFT_824657 [Rhizopogon salebrosus TDB-379]
MSLFPQVVRQKFDRFRILVVGRANAGKTTLLQKVCNTTGKPLIFDGEGNKILDPYQRGEHNINNELVFRSNPGFVFHDSCGFEAGGEDEFRKMKEFISERASTRKLNERIHAIWYCIPMDECHRAITTAEERFFSECDTNNVPVIAVFTKFDALSAVALGKLRRIQGLTRKDQFERTPKLVEEIFTNANIWGRLCGTRHPPKNYVQLAKMNIDDTDCGLLLECTTGALDDEALQMLLISTQQTNLELCITYAVKKEVMTFIKSTCQGLLQVSEYECSLMQKRIALWFPHTGVVSPAMVAQLVVHYAMTSSQ